MVLWVVELVDVEVLVQVLVKVVVGVVVEEEVW